MLRNISLRKGMLLFRFNLAVEVHERFCTLPVLRVGNWGLGSMNLVMKR